VEELRVESCTSTLWGWQPGGVVHGEGLPFLSQQPYSVFSLRSPPFSSHLPGMAAREWAVGVSSAHLQHMSDVSESGDTSMCGVSARRNGECTPWSWDMRFVGRKT